MDQLGKRLVDAGVISEEQLAQALAFQLRNGGRVGQALIALGLVTEQALETFFKRHPAAPVSLAETGVTASLLADLVLKHLFFLVDFTLAEVADKVKLPVALVESILDSLRRDRLVEVKGGGGYASVTYSYRISDTGKQRGAELLDICRYAGPAPVSLDAYRAMVEIQTIKQIVVDRERIRAAFAQMVVSDSLLERLGPAISSGKSLFLYGPPGNGKTAIAETIGGVLPDSIYVPHAIVVGGQIISVYDPVNHQPAGGDSTDGDGDRRWVRIRRPVVMVGGELTTRMLDLEYNDVARFYEAPLQLRANNGLFIIDDFGRQAIEPQQLLNRWIVPLDRRIDYLSLHTGMKFEVPFDMLVIFSTNIEPRDLVDEAFLRRISY